MFFNVISIGLIGGWLLLFGYLRESSLISIEKNVYGYQTNAQQISIGESAQLFIEEQTIWLILYVLVWAIIGPYVVYAWNKVRGKQTLAPSTGMHFRLTIWNIIVIIGMGILVAKSILPM